MKLAIAAVLAATASAFAPIATQKASTALYENKADLEALAKSSNPAIGFWDPWGLADQEFWGDGNEATIGYIRESELKHGRIAMFAFVGYCVHANGITWPWAMQMDGTPFPKVSNAPEAWDAISEEARLQILLFIGFLEYVSYVVFLGSVWHSFTCPCFVFVFAETELIKNIPHQLIVTVPS